MRGIEKREALIEVKRTYVLTLDDNEAHALFDVLSRVGGDSMTTRRKHIDRIFNCFLDKDFICYTDDMASSSSVTFLKV